MSSTQAADEEAFHQHGRALVDAVDGLIRPWLAHVTERIFDGAVPEAHRQALEAAIEHVAVGANRSLTELADADVDAPLSGPLERIRQSMGPLNTALVAANASTPARDPVDVEMQPDDIFGIGPFTFLDLGQAVHDAGITWGAAKAFVHAQRRRG